MPYSPLTSVFYKDVQIASDVRLLDRDNPAWEEQRADSVLAASGVGPVVMELARKLRDRQSKMLLATLRQANVLAEDRNQTLLVDFWQRQYTGATQPADADTFVYVREDLPRAELPGLPPPPGDSEFRVTVQFS